MSEEPTIFSIATDKCRIKIYRSGWVEASRFLTGNYKHFKDIQNALEYFSAREDESSKEICDILLSAGEFCYQRMDDKVLRFSFEKYGAFPFKVSLYNDGVVYITTSEDFRKEFDTANSAFEYFAAFTPRIRVASKVCWFLKNSLPEIIANI